MVSEKSSPADRDPEGVTTASRGQLALPLRRGRSAAANGPSNKLEIARSNHAADLTGNRQIRDSICADGQ